MVSRLSARRLRLVTRLVRARALRPLRALIAGQVLEQPLAGIDFAALGDPPPTYVPPGPKGR